MNPYEIILAGTSFPPSDSPADDERPGGPTTASRHIEAMLGDAGSIGWRSTRIRELDPDFPEEKITKGAVASLESAYMAHGQHPQNRQRLLTFVEKAILKAGVTWEMLSFNKEQLS